MFFYSFYSFLICKFITLAKDSVYAESLFGANSAQCESWLKYDLLGVGGERVCERERVTFAIKKKKVCQGLLPHSPIFPICTKNGCMAL